MLSYGVSNTADYFQYDGLNRINKEIRALGALTRFDYDSMGRLVERNMPTKLYWKRNYISPTESSERSVWGERGLQGWNHKENLNSNTITDLNNVTITYQKDVMGRVIKSSASGPDGFNETITYRYDKAGHLLEMKKQSPSSNTNIERSYDVAGHILHETVSLNGFKIADWKQGWASDQRVSLDAVENDKPIAAWNFSYNAIDKLTSMHFSGPKNMGWHYEYSEAGLLKKRQTPWHPIVLNHDFGGRIVDQHVGTQLAQELSWHKEDGKLASSKFRRDGTFMKEMWYEYNLQRRLEKELVVPEGNNEKITTVSYDFDWGSEEGLGIRTGESLRTGYKHIVSKPEVEGYARPEVETFNGITSERLLAIDTNSNNQFEEETLNTHYDPMGRVVERIFKESNQKQLLLKWDPHGRLLGVTLKDNNGIILSEWQAFYDGLGRRIQTKFIPYANSNPEEARAITLTSLYDPEVEFLELGVIIQVGKNQPRMIWKIYGASNNGFYGENNGHGGLEAVVEADTGAVQGVFNSIQGDIIAAVDDSNKLLFKKEAPLCVWTN